NLGDGGVSQRGGNLGNWGDSLDGQRLTVDDGVESVDGVGSVLNDTAGAIGLNQRVRASDGVSRAGLLLFLVVTGQGILREIERLLRIWFLAEYGSSTYGNVVAVAILRVRVVVIGNLGNNRGGDLGDSRVSQRSGNLSHGTVSSVSRGWVSDGDGVSDGHDGGEDGELCSSSSSKEKGKKHTNSEVNMTSFCLGWTACRSGTPNNPCHATYFECHFEMGDDRYLPFTSREEEPPRNATSHVFMFMLSCIAYRPRPRSGNPFDRNDACRNLGDGRVGEWSSKLGNWSHRLYHTSTTVDDGVESVDRVGSVLNDTLGAIGLDERVRTTHDISGAGLLLAFVVTGQGILARSKI
uniref:Uncharacterized protein n=1 Tax=Anopheles epiroticus TaxID=199890 RepID=A0A182PS32_9DIPT